MNDDTITVALVSEIDARGLLDTDPQARFERARGWAMEYVRRVELAERLVEDSGADIETNVRAELLEILRGDR